MVEAFDLVLLLGAAIGVFLIAYCVLNGPRARHRWGELDSSDVAAVHRRIRRPK